jgi:hypothetical protein
MPATRSLRTLVAALLVSACADAPPAATGPELADPRAAATSTVAVTMIAPSEVARNVTVDITVNGTGFDRGSRVGIELGGVVDARVRVNGTRYVKSTQLVASVTVAPDAVLALYDVAVVTSTGKKGIGTEMLAVSNLPVVLVGGSSIRGVNAAGDAVGVTSRKGVSGACQFQPTLWRLDGSVVALPLSPPYCGGGGKSISTAGTIVGHASGGGEPQSPAAIWTPTASGYLFERIPSPGDGFWPIAGMLANEREEFVSWTNSGIARLYWWSRSTGYVVLQVPAGATQCQVYGAINNGGAFAARCVMADGQSDAFHWTSYTAAPVLLPEPGAGGQAYPRGMNDAGVIVGFVTTDVQHAVRWTPGVDGYSVELLPEDGTGSIAWGIAQDGTIVGNVNPGGGRQAAIWHVGGGFTYLPVPRGNQFGEALGIAVTPGGWFVVGQTSSGWVRWRIDG